ncbi:MAG: oxidoreductase [Bradyrhizobiaceae bacterium]|nr:MAG: oxidoreductase [Bradyrhizobiaceae bacterium]
MQASQPTHWQSAKVVAIETRTPRVKSFFLTPEQPFAFSPGQHLDIRLTAPDGYRAMRSYSIASASGPAAPVEIAVERLEDGEVSAFLHDEVRVGDDLDIRGPLGGHFVWPGGEQPVLLIGGGSGVVPLASMARHRHAAGLQAPMALLCSARTWDEALFRDELIGFDAIGGGFVYGLALTRETPRRPQDFSGRINAAMLEKMFAHLPAPPAEVFVCGANGFVNTAADAVLSFGIAASAIRTERYGGAG